MRATWAAVLAAGLTLGVACKPPTGGGLQPPPVSQGSGNGSGNGSGTGSTGGSGGSTGSSGGACAPCTTAADCQSGLCVPLGSDSYCLAPCGSGCDSYPGCQQVADYSGASQTACVPASGACGADSACPGGCTAPQACDVSTQACVGGSGTTSGSSGSSGTTGSQTCGTQVGPGVSAGCHCPANHQADCQANGCYGGWWCDTATNRCNAPPTSCSTTGTTTGSTGTTGSSGSSGTSGTAWTGSVTAQGGTVSRLYFTAVGDTRPGNIDDTANYPTAIITKIYQDMASLNPRSEFVLTTGDHLFASKSGSEGAAQLALYQQARQNFPGTVFPAMGNHECTGATASNCYASGYSNNYDSFLSTMLGPLGRTTAYYSFDVNDTAGQWTSRFLVLAPNAWTTDQQTWLDQQLSQPKPTYLFIVMHEPDSATTAPGVTPILNALAAHGNPETLRIVGHTHTFQHPASREVIVGNGGAPLTGAIPYGFALIEQLPSGDLQVSEMDYQSNAPVWQFTVPK